MPSPCASGRTPRRAASRRKPGRAPTRTAARWAPIIRRITPPPVGTGSPPCAAAISASGAISTSIRAAPSPSRIPSSRPLCRCPIRADVTVQATLRNSGTTAVNGVLRGRFGDVAFETPVTIDPGTAKAVKLDPTTTPALHLTNPKLWWPAGYGDQNLYQVQLTFETAGKKVSDTKRFRTGVRQFTYTEENAALKIFINGRRFIARGGNWGFPEVNLRYRAREYDVAVRYHKDMHFTMIRNWVGQTGDDEFFDACDKYGIVVWQDFWLANPVDGPIPNDNDMFLKNSEDFIQRIRNHPSIGLYCGRNEGNPPQPIDDGLKAQIASLHPGMHYIPSSSQGTVSGGGPYQIGRAHV